MNYSRRGFLSTTPVVRAILIINIILFIGSYFLDNIGIDLHKKFALYPFSSQYFAPYQFVTHMFMHAKLQYGGIAHIFFNMFAVVLFGRVIENVWGGKRFFIFYIASGLGAAALHLLITQIQIGKMLDMMNYFYNNPSSDLLLDIVHKYLRNPSVEFLSFIQSWMDNPDNTNYAQQAKIYVSQISEMYVDIPMVGASGAVFGILVAFAILFPNVELMIIFFPVPIKAKYLIPAYAILELFFGIANFQWDNVAHFAHLGGAVVGFILVKIWKRNRFNMY